MDKVEAGERARAGLACLDVAVKALEQASVETGGAVKNGLDIKRANDAIGKLQEKLLVVYQRATGRAQR